MQLRQLARRTPPALRHVVTHRVVFAAVVVTALITAVFTAASVSFISAVIAVAARSELGGRPGTAIVVTATVNRGDIQRSNDLVTSMMRGQSPGLAVAIHVSLQSGVLNLPRRKSAAVQLQTQLISLPELAAHVKVLSGTCGGTGHDPIPACVQEAAATALGLTTGDRVMLRDTVTHAVTQVLITGVYQPIRPNGDYWKLDQLGGAVQRGGRFTEAGPLVISPAAAASGNFAYESAAWLGQPDLATLAGANLAALSNQLANRIAALPESGTLLGDSAQSPTLPDAIVTTNLPGELNSLATALVVTRTEMLSAILTLLVVAGATLSLAVRLLAQRREGETALLAARGASRVQLARRGLIDAALVAVPAAVAGPPLGVILAKLLIRSNAATSSGVVLRPHATAAVWLATAAVAAGCVAIIALPWLRRPPSPLRRRVSRGRQRSIAAAVYARADLAVVALAAAAAWQLIHSSGPVATGLDGNLSADPILVLAPVLALVGGALLTLRALPLAARLSDRVAARGRGLVVAAAAWQISRRALRQTGPTLVGVLAVAAAMMAVSQRDSWQQSVQAQASFDVGADLRVNMPPAAPLPLGRVTEVTGAPGVLASSPAVRLSFSLPGGNAATLLALNTLAAARIIPPQAAGPSPSVLRKLASGGQDVGVAVPGRPAGLRLTATLGRAALGQPVLFVQLTDAAGISYVLPAGRLPADGKRHALAVTFAAGNHADYPLRITGFSLQYAMSNAFATSDTLAISTGETLATPESTGGREFPVAVPGKSMISTASVNPDSSPPSIVRAQATPDGGIDLVFDGGHAGTPGEPASITLSDRYPANGKPLAAIVTRSFLATTGLRLGGRLQASIDGTTVNITPLAAVKYLPTISAGTLGILVDQRALASALQAAGAPPEGISEWWLRMSGDPVPTGLPTGTVVTSRALIAMTLLADPLSLAAQQALLAIAIAVLLLAIIGLLVSVASAAERARDVALLDALGMPPGQVARLLGLEQALTAGATSAIGLMFGAALSLLIVPAVVLTSQAAKPVPSLVVQLPWLLATVVALAMAALPTLAITLAVPRRTSASAAIRLEDEL